MTSAGAWILSMPGFRVNCGFCMCRRASVLECCSRCAFMLFGCVMACLGSGLGAFALAGVCVAAGLTVTVTLWLGGAITTDLPFFFTLTGMNTASSSAGLLASAVSSVLGVSWAGSGCMLVKKFLIDLPRTERWVMCLG